jgi:3-oxoacyl-[acyl-carrier-protein] synthase II
MEDLSALKNNAGLGKNRVINGRRVVITGLGVISSIGIGKNDFWQGLLQGKSGISPISDFSTEKHFTHNGGEVKIFDPAGFLEQDRLMSMNRATQMALASAKLAIEDSLLTAGTLSAATVGVSHGTTLGAAQAIEDINDLLLSKKALPRELLFQMPPHAAPSEIAREFHCTGPHFMVSTACSAGNYAVAHAFDLIKLNKADIMLAGASDGISRIEFTGFNQFSAVAPEKCQPFDINRKGMIPAEGAGMLIIESLESALARKAPIYGEITGYGLSCDAFHMTNASRDGITECMRKALRDSGITADDIDYISAHGTGTKANDRAECAAIKEVFGSRNTPAISSIKSMLGHAMGAASALEAIACALVVKNDIIPPTINFETPDPECAIDCVPHQARRKTVRNAMNNSYAFGGNNASLIISKYI